LGSSSAYSAIGAALLNVALMLIFGWQGYECLDEWTMAALGFAISVSVMLYGPSPYSLDNVVTINSLRSVFTRPVAIALVLFSAVFTVGFYNYYFRILDLKRRTSVDEYHIVAEPGPATDVATLYVNGGGSANGTYVRSITFSLKDGSTVEQTAEELDVLKSYFEPWAQSGVITDGFLQLRLGSKTDIRLPKGAVSATIDLIGNPDQTVQFK
jgi:thiosulfate dehydrogenase (quinone)